MTVPKMVAVALCAPKFTFIPKMTSVEANRKAQIRSLEPVRMRLPSSNLLICNQEFTSTGQMGTRYTPVALSSEENLYARAARRFRMNDERLPLLNVEVRPSGARGAVTQKRQSQLVTSFAATNNWPILCR